MYFTLQVGKNGRERKGERENGEWRKGEEKRRTEATIVIDRHSRIDDFPRWRGLGGGEKEKGEISTINRKP